MAAVLVPPDAPIADFIATKLWNPLADGRVDTRFPPNAFGMFCVRYATFFDFTADSDEESTGASVMMTSSGIVAISIWRKGGTGAWYCT